MSTAFLGTQSLSSLIGSSHQMPTPQFVPVSWSPSLPTKPSFSALQQTHHVGSNTGTDLIGLGELPSGLGQLAIVPHTETASPVPPFPLEHQGLGDLPGDAAPVYLPCHVNLPEHIHHHHMELAAWLLEAKTLCTQIHEQFALGLQDLMLSDQAFLLTHHSLDQVLCYPIPAQ